MKREILLKTGMFLIAAAGILALSPVNTEAAARHKWKTYYDTKEMQENAGTEQVWVVEQEAYDEPVYETVSYGECGTCKERFDTYQEWAQEHALALLEKGDPTHGHYIIHSYQKKTGEVIHHDEVGHYETTDVTKTVYYRRAAGKYCLDCYKVRAYSRKGKWKKYSPARTGKFLTTEHLKMLGSLRSLRKALPQST